MTPEEASLLNGIGHDVVQNFVSIVNKSFLITVYTYLVVKACFILLHKDRRRNAVSILTLAAIIVMFLIAVVLWTLDFVNFIMEAKLTLIQASPDIPLSSQHSAALNFIFKLADAEDALYSYSSFLGDAIIVWRIYFLTPHGQKWITIFPFSVLVGSFIATIMLTYCVGHLGSLIIAGAFENPAFCKNVQLVSYSMAFATTTVATFLIGVTTWNYRKLIKPLMNNTEDRDGNTRKSSRTQVEWVLLLLVESGVLYFLFFAVQLLGDIQVIEDWINTKSGVVFAFGMYQYCSSILVGIYPTAIVVLSHSKHAVLDPAANSMTVSAFNATPGRSATTTLFGTGTSTTTTTTHHGGRKDQQSEEKEPFSTLRLRPYSPDGTRVDDSPV